MAGATIRAQIKLEGGRAFADDFDKSAAAIKSANTQIKYFTNEVERNGRSDDALIGKLKALKSAYDEEGRVIENLRNRIQEVSNMEGDNEKVLSNLTTELYRHKDAQDQLQTEMDQTRQQMHDFERGADTASKEVKELGDDSQTAGDKISGAFAQEVARATVGLQTMWEIGKKVGKFIIDIGKDAIAYNAEMESYSKTIEAFFKTSGQTAEQAAANTAELIQNQKDLAVQTGIGTDRLIDANKMLIASGVSGDRSQRAISALAKAIVATGGGNDELTRMAQNLQQIQNAGKAAENDIKQFAYAGVDLWSLMADSTGKSVAELKEMDITYDMIVEALTLATQEGGKFYEASQVGASTLNGQMNLLQTTIKDKLGTAFEPFNTMLRDEVIPKALELAEQIDWESLGVMMSDAAKLASEAFGVLAETIGTVAEAYVTIKGAIDDWGNVSERVTNDVSQNYIGMAGSFKKAYDNELRFSQGTVPVVRNVRDMTSQVNQSIAGIPTSIDRQYGPTQSASTRLGQAAKSGVSGLSSEMSRYGNEAGTGFASGLSGSVGSIMSAAASAAQAVRRYMHFSRPDEGPLRDYEQWMPDMVAGMAKGIDDNIWRLQQSSMRMAGTLAAATAPVTNYNGGININVNAAQGQNAKDIADEVMVRIQQATTRRQATWA